MKKLKKKRKLRYQSGGSYQDSLVNYRNRKAVEAGMFTIPYSKLESPQVEGIISTLETRYPKNPNIDHIPIPRKLMGETRTAKYIHGYTAPKPVGQSNPVSQKKPWRTSYPTFQPGGPIIVDPLGQYAHPGQPTRIPSNSITMRNIDYPVKAYPNKGKPKMMYPGASYQFPGASYVDEYPMAQRTISSKGQAKMGGSQDQFPDEISFPEKRKNDFLQWLRETSFDVIKSDLQGEQQQFDDYMKKGGWIQKAVKHPGRCTKGSPNYDCPKGSPQWNLAQRFKHGDLHKAQYGQPVMNQYPGAYNPWYDYIPNTGQKSYKQYSLNPMDVTMTDPNNIGTPDFPGVQPTGPRATQDTYNPMWTNEDLQTRNSALNQASGNLPLIQDDQQALGNRNKLMKDITNVPPEQYRSVNTKTKRPAVGDRWWANPDLINAGMEGVTNILNWRDRLKKEKELRKKTSADYWNVASRGNRGDYIQNYGYFKPDQTTPIQYPGAAGQYKSGGTYYITPQDEKRIKAMGGTVEYID